jgi:nanoRNase/pAp phosphatase (c-di-AMP/oligoRNAs hydrolase)
MRLITRSDFDGLVCAMLFKKLNMVDEMKFVHPKDMQDGVIAITENDIITNLPFVTGCGLWFDHHSSELARNSPDIEFKGENRVAPSAARVVYDYYGGKAAFGDIDDIMAGVDKADSAQFSSDDILNPKGWDLLSFLMDARTGLGRHRDFRISNYQLMERLVDELCAVKSAEEILALPDVKERVERYLELDKDFRSMLQKHTRTDGNVIITDLRNVETIYPGNRFMIYALYPQQNISIWVVDGRAKVNCVIACGHSIINRTSKTNIGDLMLARGGGGHSAAGTCQVPYNDADQELQALIAAMKTAG